MTTPRPAFVLAFALVLALGGQAGLAAQPGPAATAQAGGAASVRARLLRGPEPVKGLPFFGPNAIPALSGLYDVGGQDLRVWSCRETLWLSPEWKPLPSGLDTVSKAFLLQKGPGAILALVAKDYRLFVELPEDSAILRRFAASLDRRFLVFFQNAKSDAELSFPAYVDFKK